MDLCGRSDDMDWVALRPPTAGCSVDFRDSVISRISKSPHREMKKHPAGEATGPKSQYYFTTTVINRAMPFWAMESLNAGRSFEYRFLKSDPAFSSCPCSRL